jgi:purine-binding chemotaxis protein CheW
VNTGVSSQSTPVTVAGSSLVCRIGARLLAIALADVLEVMRPLPIEILPDLPAFISGISTIRGQVAPVIDLGVLIGADRSTPARFVTTSVNGRIVALAVDQVIGIEQIAKEVLAGLPPLIGSVDREMFSAIATRDAHLLLVLDAAHLVPDAAWAQLNQVTTS